MALTGNTLAHVLVTLYARRAGALMAPVFGIMVRVGRTTYACTVAHAVDDRDDELAVWSGVHPDVARSFNMGSGARCLARVDLRAPGTGIVSDLDRDLLAVPLARYEGPSLDARVDVIEGEAGLLQPVLVAFPEYEPDEEGVLHRQGNGIAGLVCREDAKRCVVSVQGCAGMSGAPAMVAKEGGLRCIGLYTGTPRTTPLTLMVVEPLAQVAKIDRFVRELDG